MSMKIILIITLSLLILDSHAYRTYDADIESGCKNLNEHVLDLSQTEMRHLRKPLIINDKIFCIHLENNHISDIANKTFNKVPNLKYLNLAGNLLSFDKLNFDYHPSIEILVLDEALERKHVRNYQNLLQHLSHLGESETKNAITFTPAFALPQLKKLYLCGNEITSVLTDVRLNELFPKLTYLYLSNNQISEVNFIKYAPSSLTHLYLDENIIENMANVPLKTLQELNVDNNKINQLCGLESKSCQGINLSDAINLKTLYVSRTGLQKIDLDAFSNATNLKYLDLSYNRLQKVNMTIFDPLVNLEFLRLDGNQLQVVPNLQSLPSLSYFFLRNNQIESIDESAFNGLSKLKGLKLSGNAIVHVHPEAFHKLTSLEELDLSHNKLRFLPDNWISSQSIIRNLDLSHNLFYSFDGFGINNAVHLRNLDISNNQFTSISIPMLMTLSNNITLEIGNTCINSTKL